MIARLTGILLDKMSDSVVIDVSGVGYLVNVSLTTLFGLPEINQQATLHIHTVVREDAFLLYGFDEKSEREVFQILIKVNGIGPKSALTILSSVSPKELVFILKDKDVNRLVKLPGIGKKTAERLLVELADKMNEGLFGQVAVGDSRKQNKIQTNSRIEATQALVSLGYKPAHADKMVSMVHGEGLSCEFLIKEALKAPL